MKSVAEIKATSTAEQAQIKADAELQNAIVQGETLVTKTKDETKGRCEAEMVNIDAVNTCNKQIASKMLEIANLKADTINTVGNGEAQVSTVMASRRKYEYLGKKLDVIRAFKDNKNLKIYGDNQDDILSQMAAYRITDGKGGLH